MTFTEYLEREIALRQLQVDCEMIQLDQHVTDWLDNCGDLS